MQHCIERLGPHRLGPRNQIKTFKHVVCVRVCMCTNIYTHAHTHMRTHTHIYIKIPPQNEIQTNKKPKSVYLLSDLSTNQKLHRIYFVQGPKPLSVWNNS